MFLCVAYFLNSLILEDNKSPQDSLTNGKMNWLSSKASSHPLASSHHATTEVLRWYFLILSQLCRSEESTLSQENDWKFPILAIFHLSEYQYIKKVTRFLCFFRPAKALLLLRNIYAFTLQYLCFHTVKRQVVHHKKHGLCRQPRKNSSIILTLPTSFPSRTSNGTDKNPTTDLYYSSSRLIFFLSGIIILGSR